MPCPQAVGVLLWCVSWADLFYSFHGMVHGRPPAPVFFITPLVVGITMVSVGPRRWVGWTHGLWMAMGELWALGRRRVPREEEGGLTLQAI